MGIFKEAIVKDEAILELIPQKHPIVMVDAFFGIEEEISKTALTILEENMFCENGAMSECGVIEHIAQSAAVRVGYLFKSNQQEVPLGYIGSLNKFVSHRIPLVGERLETTIIVEQEVMGITLISAEVKVEDEVLAVGKMKIFIQQ